MSAMQPCSRTSMQEPTSHAAAELSDARQVQSSMPDTRHGMQAQVARVANESGGNISHGGNPVDGHSRQQPALWVLAGLGARGLVYHAWLGAQVAAAVLAGDESVLAPELCAWRSVPVSGAVFEA